MISQRQMRPSAGASERNPNGRNQANRPDPSEIRFEMACVREAWSPAERRRRKHMAELSQRRLLLSHGDRLDR
jgi:hypothetical protein